jgi:hypothetical protein
VKIRDEPGEVPVQEDDDTGLDTETATGIENHPPRGHTERVRTIAREVAFRDAQLLDLLAR